MHTAPESLISHSHDAAVVSDPRQPDNPIIACNHAFMQLTGFTREEILGRNCRFLRGERTEPEQTALLRAAVADGRAAMVELTNYKKDGTPFRNAVMIAPLFDTDGKLAYFLGSQMEIDEGAEALDQPVAAGLGAAWRGGRRTAGFEHLIAQRQQQSQGGEHRIGDLPRAMAGKHVRHLGEQPGKPPRRAGF